MNISSGVYNKNKHNHLRVQILIPKVSGGFQVIVEPCTRIQTLVIEIAKKLGVDFLQSNINLYKKLERAPIDPTSTIQQNGIKDREQLLVQITSTNAGWSYYTKTHDFETVSEYHKYLPKKYIAPGLNMEGMCVNPRCVNYGKMKVIPLGLGQFNISSLLAVTKCHICPDRDKGTNPPMCIKEVVLVSCYWRYEGDMTQKDGFPSRSYAKGWRKVEECDVHAFADLYAKQKWTNLDIVCKGL